MFAIFGYLAVRALLRCSTNYVQGMPKDKQLGHTPESIMEMLKSPIGITRIMCIMNPVSAEEQAVYDLYMADPDRYKLETGFDREKRANDRKWMYRLLNVAYDSNAQWRVASQKRPVLDKVAYELEHNEYKDRSRRRNKLKDQYVQRKFSPMQKECIDMLLKHNFDILGLRPKTTTYNHAEQRFYTDDELVQNAVKTTMAAERRQDKKRVKFDLSG